MVAKIKACGVRLPDKTTVFTVAAVLDRALSNAEMEAVGPALVAAVSHALDAAFPLSVTIEQGSADAPVER